MKSNIFLPKIIKVGFVERTDTFTGKLAYVIYYDDKGKLRKEPSWEEWRNKTIDPIEYDNNPIEGFVLNKKVGGVCYSWNPRQTYTRIFDPRGFEFEITIPNLLYILENTNSIKGKGLEGKFVYGWSGADIILMPVGSPDYEQLKNYNESIVNKEKHNKKTIVLGGTYLTNKNETWIYLGEFDNFHYSNYNKTKESRYFFVNQDNRHVAINAPGINKKLIKCISNECVYNYSELVDDLLCYDYISPIDVAATKMQPVSTDEIVNHIKNHNYCDLYLPIPHSDGLYIEFYVYKDGDTIYINYIYDIRTNEKKSEYYFKPSPMTEELKHQYHRDFNQLGLEGFNEKYNLLKKQIYLKNGNLKREGYLS